MTVTTAGAQVRMVTVATLAASTSNPRGHLDDIDELAASIREHGLLQPLIVQTDPAGLRIVAGHRRVAALKRLGIHTAPAIVIRDLLPDEELAVMLVENGQRANLDPIEEAHALKRLVDMGHTHDDIARQIGRSPAYVARRLLLTRLTPEEQAEVRAGQRPITAAVEQVQIERRVTAPRTPAQQKQTAKQPAAAHFDAQHPLAPVARERCRRGRHTARKITGGQACGACWEATIRADAVAA